MRSKWISLRQIKIHEFHCTLRHIRRSGASWPDIYLRLGQVQTDTGTRAVKAISGLLIPYLLLFSLGNTKLVSITIQGITASIPTTYVAALASLMLFVALQHLVSAYMVIEIRAAESSRHRLPRFSAGMFGVYNEQDEMALITPAFVSNFFVERLPISRLLTFAVLASYFVLLFPPFAFGCYLSALQFEIFLDSNVQLLSRAVAVVGLAILFASTLFLVLFNVPLPVKKYAFGIRWGLLSRLHNAGKHPQLDEWFADEEGKKR